MKSLPCTLIIPTMNRPDSLKKTLETYFAANFVPSQVIVVDQSQNIEIKNENFGILNQYSHFSKVEYYYQEKPSLTHARNVALEAASYDLLIISDDDVDVKQDTLSCIAEIMNDKNVALLAGIQSSFKQKYPFIGYITGFRSYKYRKIGHVTKAMLGKYPVNVSGEVETQWAMGYFFVARKSLIEKWGITWDENMTGYCYAEDLAFSFAYCKKANAENMKCILSERVKVVHRHSIEYRTPSLKHTYMYVVNRRYLNYKFHGGWTGTIVLHWSDFCMLMMRLLQKNRPQDMLKAIIYADKNSKEIKSGNVYVEGIY